MKTVKTAMFIRLGHFVLEISGINRNENRERHRTNHHTTINTFLQPLYNAIRHNMMNYDVKAHIHQLQALGKWKAKGSRLITVIYSSGRSATPGLVLTSVPWWKQSHLQWHTQPVQLGFIRLAQLQLFLCHSMFSSSFFCQREHLRFTSSGASVA